MDWSQLINDLLYVVITVVLPIVASYFVKYLHDEKKNASESELISNALTIIEDAVIKTNQVYVDAIKQNPNLTFDLAKQKEAFNQAKTAAINLICQEAVDVIEEKYKSFDSWLNLELEKYVNKHK